MYYKWIDWLSWATFKYDRCMKSIDIMCSGYKFLNKKNNH